MGFKSKTHNRGFLKFLAHFANQRNVYGTTDQHRKQLSMRIKSLKRKR